MAGEHYLLPAVLSLQPGAVSLSGGETGHCSAVGPEQWRSTEGYTPRTTRRLHPDLGKKKQEWVKLGKWWTGITGHWFWNTSVTWSLLGGETDGCGCRCFHQLLTHPAKGKDLPALDELRGAEWSLHPWKKQRRKKVNAISKCWSWLCATKKCN